MNMRQWIALATLMAAALSLGGCAHGSGLEFGAFGSSLDSEDLGTGYGGGAKVEINPVDLVSVDARASWIHFSDVNIDMIPLEAAALLNFSALGERIVAYVGVGGGYYLFENDGEDLDDEVGFFPLVGMEVGFHRVSVLAEARWLFLEADVDSAEDELQNLDDANVDGFGVNVGLLFRF
jgi:opacity protein-like surface antigen